MADAEADVFCIIHFQNVNLQDNLTKFTDVAWSRVVECQEQWNELDGEEKEVGKTFASYVEAGFNPSNSKYHRRCYQRLTNGTTIRRAVKRCASGSVNLDSVSASAPQRLTRASTHSSFSKFPCKNNRVLPQVCIICQKDNVYKNERGARVLAKLSTCQTDGKKLLELAEAQQDEKILLHLRTRADLASAEVSYHNKCYRNYTRKWSPATCVLSADSTDTIDNSPHAEDLRDNVFEDFCSHFISEKLSADKHVSTLKDLHQQYVRCVKKKGDEFPHAMCRQTLKKKLSARFPDLHFLRRSQNNKSDLVYFSAEALTSYNDQDSDNFPSSGEDESDSETSDHNMEVQSHNQSVSSVISSSARTELYMSALFLKSELHKCPAPLRDTFPVYASDVTDQTAKHAVPCNLYNFMAYVTGLAEDPVFGDYVTPQDSVAEKKLSSICQDIVFLCSKGKKPTPKHVALATTVRHLTGSSKLIDILNGFGHSVSSSYALEQDTALANAQLKQDSVTPDGFKKNHFTTLVFDNSDFKEETLSGKGTTHCTSGIIIQRQDGVADSFSEQQTGRNAESVREAKANARTRRVAAPDISLPVYVQKQRKGPAPASHPVDTSPAKWDKIMSLPHILDQLFWFAKLPAVQNKKIPSWTGFNKLLQEGLAPPVCKIGYLPIIDSSPTDMSTVLAILQRGINIANELDLQRIVLVFDQAIYAKAQVIRWQHEDYTKRLILRLGEFHTTMAFLSVLGKKYEDSGLNDILAQSGVVAEKSVNGVLTGTFYNRSIRCYKLLAEAFCRLQWQEFLDTLPSDQQEEALQFGADLNVAFPGGFTSLAFEEQGEKLVAMFTKHRQQRSSVSPNYALWDSFLVMVADLLLFIRATREGSFQLHLGSVRHMMPWFFALDKQNYARFLTIYWIEMMQLQFTHPDVHDAFLEGEFVVQREPGEVFSQSACDLVIEQTVNREAKTGGGLIGITRNRGAMHRWLLARLPRAAITTACCKLAGREERRTLHKDLTEARMEKDESDIQRLTSTISEMTNPFVSTHPMLINLSSGAVADADLTKDLLSAKQKGESACQSFIQERLHTNEKEFFKPIPRMNLKTFKSLHRPSQDSEKQRISSLKASRTLTTRVLLASRVRDVSLRSVLKYSLSELPSALSNQDGTMTKTEKSKLGTYVVNLTEAVVSQVAAEATIIDGMALLHQLVHIPTTFGELANLLLRRVLAISQMFNSKRVDFVCDRYPQLSIKGQERSRRTTKTVCDVHISRENQQVPVPFSRYLTSGHNKENFMEFMCEQWQTLHDTIPQDVSVYVTNGNLCYCVQHGGSQRVAELECDHEEADTRLLLHAKHAAITCASVVIKSPDTDVLMLSACFASHVDAELLLTMGTASAAKNLSASALSRELGEEVCSSLVGLHCFTGCDSVSAFRGKGKTKAVKLVLKDRQFQQAFSSLGSSWLTTEEMCTTLERFTCALYGDTLSTDIDEVRFLLFSRDLRAEDTLPPTKDCLMQHIKRANYQAAIHRRALQQNISPPSPTHHGWEVQGTDLVMKWMTLPTSPHDLIHMVTCGCAKSGCETSRCSCQAAGLVCTDMCKCQSCKNVETHSVIDSAADTMIDGSNSEDSDADIM